MLAEHDVEHHKQDKGAAGYGIQTAQDAAERADGVGVVDDERAEKDIE